MFKYIHDLGFSIRLLKGEGISLEELNSISIELSIVLGSDIKDGVIL